MAQLTKKVTLKDIAQHIGCSKAVVSTVLNQSKGNTGASQQMRDKIQQVALDLGYRPNFSSQALAKQRTQTFGAYIPPQPWGSIGSNYESVIFRGIEKACQELDYDLLIFNRFGDLRQENCLEKLYQHRVDGLLLIHAQSGSDYLKDFIKTGVPIVGVDYSNPEPEIDAITFDNAGAIHQAMNHLVALGHTRIGYIGAPSKHIVPDHIIRRDNYIQALQRVGLPMNQEWIFDENHPQFIAQQNDSTLHPTTQFYLNLPADKRPTAVIVFNDLTAVELIQDLTDQDIKIPNDLSVVSVDDSAICRMIRPRITSMQHPLEAMGYRATQLLHARAIETTEDPFQAIHELFSSKIVTRQSTCKQV